MYYISENVTEEIASYGRSLANQDLNNSKIFDHMTDWVLNLVSTFVPVTLYVKEDLYLKIQDCLNKFRSDLSIEQVNK